MYISRAANSTLNRYLKTFRVVGLTGPRQSGKSTFLTHQLNDYHYVSFDDVKNVLSYMDDPVGFINQYKEKTIFDEVQLVPEIFKTIKIVVDKNPHQYGQYILTGSNQFQFVEKITESLAGRIGLMTLLPFQYSEMPKAFTQESIYQGAYPELVTRHYSESSLWYASYINTYLNKDVRALSQIGDMRDFQQLIKLLAAQTSQELDLSSYARDIGVSVPTIKRWISILEASYIIFLIPPFYKNYGKRIIKSPKIYFYDTGLVSFFTGITSYEQFNQGPMAGSIFENYIVSEIMKKEIHLASNASLYYLRTQDKAEIDLIVDRKSSKDFIEIKKTETFHPKMITTLKKFADENTRNIVLYRGENFKHKDVMIMPYWEYLL